MAHTLADAKNLVCPALVTPLTPSGELDATSTERLVDHLYAQGVGGLYVTGSTGEGVYLDFVLRRRLVDLVASLSHGRGKVIVHVGAIQASQAFELAEHAALAGADCISSIPPFVGGYSWDEIEGYYRRLVAAAGLPVLAYYIPGLTGGGFSLDQLTALVRLPGVLGLKFTDYNLYLMQRLIARMGGDQILFNGPDELLAFGLAFGAKGGIGTTYNIMPALILKIAADVRAGRLAEAVESQKLANAVIEPLLCHQGLAATKQVLYWQGLIDSPTCAPPRATLSTEAQAELRRRISATTIGETLVR